MAEIKAKKKPVKARKAIAKTAVAKTATGKISAAKTPNVKTVKPVKQVLPVEVLMKDYEILIHPLISEKAVNMIETQNKLTFVVNKASSKKDVKKAVEQLYAVKVTGIQTLLDMKGRKKA
ncbi:MAG: 50S ribosomal protein L23, partial [Candidatus Diapherotrites archaeon]|nr:50S ribosomal protein L23 [Candidatus Diapherotrites archaeon]